MSAEELAGEVLHGDGAAWLYGSSLHGDAPLDGAGSAIAGVWLNILGHAVGWPSPQGGAGQITAALASSLHELGGQTRASAPAAADPRRHGRSTACSWPAATGSPRAR